jgi:uncharacterized protein DUF5677
MATLDSIDVTDANADLFMVTTSMLATAMNNTKAIWILVEAGFGLAAGPIERALYEIRNELIYLLTQGDQHQNATKVFVNGALGVADFLEKSGNAGTTEEVIAHHRARHSDIVDEIIAQRTGRPCRYHWSGKSHSAIERIVLPGFPMYRILSWEAHAALNAVRDVRTVRTGSDTATFVIGREPNDRVAIDRCCAVTTAMMYDMLREYVATWNLEMLPELPGTMTSNVAKMSI